MKQLYLSGIIAMILWPFCVNATHIFGTEAAASVESCQSPGYVTRDLTVQVPDTVNPASSADITALTTVTEDEVGPPKVQLYPNPTQGDFTLEVNDDTWLGATASIHNIIGQEMDQRSVTLGKNAYSIAEYQPGIYFLTLRQGELQKVLRFVKR